MSNKVFFQGRRLMLEVRVHPEQVDVKTASFILRRLLSGSTTDGGIGCEQKKMDDGTVRLRLYDFYNVRHIGIFNKLLHYFRKGLTAITSYVNVKLKTRINIPTVIVVQKSLSMVLIASHGPDLAPDSDKIVTKA